MRATLVLSAVLASAVSTVVAKDDDLEEGVVRIDADRDDQFPMGVVRIGFEKDGTGKAILRGTDVAMAYVAKGCMFESSVAGSAITIQAYNVGGRSGGQCVANHAPLYQGAMTIRFCKPGDAKAPATVTTVGFWTSHVTPGGTQMVAYDTKGNEIATVLTQRAQRDFLAIRSKKTPIAYIKIVPNVDLDPDYAIDDLVFDKPDHLMGMKK